MKIKKILRSGILLMGIVAMGMVIGTGIQAAYHSPADTVTALKIIEDFKEPGGNPAKLMGPIAERFIDVSYYPVTKNDTLGIGELRLDGVDEMSLISVVAGLARTATSPGHKRPVDCEVAINEFTFRRGEPNGFASRMIYGADWALDTKARGLVKELTETYSDQFRTKSLDKVTRNRNQYAALNDSATYEAQRMVEMGFRTHKIPHMKRESTEWKQVAEDLQDGDILMLLTPEVTTDTYEIGILRERPDGLHFIHVSQDEGKVVEEKEPIGRYIRRNAKKIYGYRWLRLAQ